jgi:hypothetical protein
MALIILSSMVQLIKLSTENAYFIMCISSLDTSFRLEFPSIKILINSTLN